MLWHYNPIDVERALREAAPEPPFPPVADRAAWAAIGDALGAEGAAALVARAEAAAREPIPALPATLFLEFDRTGERDGYQHPRERRRDALAALVLAECLESRGRFLDPILDWAWAICEESAWVLPAHQRVLTDVARPVIDLGAAMTALQLAETDALVGARLDPALGKRIRDEVDRRCLTPFLTRHDAWWLYNTAERTVNNWTAVCVGGVVGAATYLEADPARLAELIARGLRSLEDYLATFDEDGGSSEGPGYWSYGFGYYTILAHLLEHRTGGAVRPLDGERIRQIARYPLRTALSPGRSVNFSDCDRDVRFEAAHLAYLARRLDLPELMPLARSQPNGRHELAWRLRALVWRPAPEPPGDHVPARRDYFRGMQWLIARHDPADPDGLVLAAKGGHNQEMHNQNDVGTFIVHLGGESLVADLGRGRYTRAYFGPERYDHLVNSSLGHPVPVVNGQAQRPGRARAARLLERRETDAEDALVLDLQDAYPTEADLVALRRAVALRREPPRGHVTLEDAVQFATAPGEFESVLTTFGRAEPAGEGALVLRGERGALRVDYDPAVVAPRVEVIPDVDLAEGPTPVTRVHFALRQPMREATVRLELTPEPAG